jgi:hypothetical protein
MQVYTMMDVNVTIQLEHFGVSYSNYNDVDEMK